MPRESRLFDSILDAMTFVKKRSLSFASNVKPANRLLRSTSAPYGPPSNASLAIAASGPPDSDWVPPVGPAFTLGTAQPGAPQPTVAPGLLKGPKLFQSIAI